MGAVSFCFILWLPEQIRHLNKLAAKKLARRTWHRARKPTRQRSIPSITHMAAIADSSSPWPKITAMIKENQIRSVGVVLATNIFVLVLTINDLHHLQAQHCIQLYHSCTAGIVLLAWTSIAVMIYPDNFDLYARRMLVHSWLFYACEQPFNKNVAPIRGISMNHLFLLLHRKEIVPIS